jgi:four helix bundle protein
MTNKIFHIFDCHIRCTSTLNLTTMNQFSFERLEVWNDSRNLSKLIYLVTKNFPGDEKFGLAGQLRRASVSVSSNIVEGSYRNSNKDKYNFMNIAFSSLMELLSQIILSKDLEYITNEQYVELRDSIEKTSNKLASLSNYFKKK